MNSIFSLLKSPFKNNLRALILWFFYKRNKYDATISASALIKLIRAQRPSNVWLPKNKRSRALTEHAEICGYF